MGLIPQPRRYSSHVPRGAGAGFKALIGKRAASHAIRKGASIASARALIATSARRHGISSMGPRVVR